MRNTSGHFHIIGFVFETRMHEKLWSKAKHHKQKTYERIPAYGNAKDNSTWESWKYQGILNDDVIKIHFRFYYNIFGSIKGSYSSP